MSWVIKGSKPYVDLEDTDTAKKIRIQNDAGDTKIIDPSTGSEVTINGVTITSHASRHNRGGADAIDWSNISKWLNKSATGVTIGVAGSPVSILRVDVETNYYNLLLKTIKLTPSGLGSGESVTYHIIFYFSDGTNVEVATKTGITASITLTDADIDWSKIPDGVRVTAIEVTAESSATSTTATSDAVIVALEF